MQSTILRRSSIAARPVARPIAVRYIATSPRCLEDAKKRDNANDSMKRGAANAAGAVKKAGNTVVETLKDVGDAAKGIFGDGKGEYTSTKGHAKDMVSERISGKNKHEKV